MLDRRFARLVALPNIYSSSQLTPANAKNTCGFKCSGSLTGLPLFPLKTPPPQRDTHLSWAKKVTFKTTKIGNMAMGQKPRTPSEHPNPH